MNPKKPTVTLEQLLKVKRAERPAPEFWADFERELRAKQLAAIVGPRPWWAPFIRFGGRIAHYQLPLGAAAVLAVSFITVREYRSTSAVAPSAPEISVSTEATRPLASRISEQRVGAAEHTLAVGEAVDHMLSQASAERVPAIATPVHESVPAAPDERPAFENEPSPSALYIAANLAAAQADDPSLMDDVFGAVAARRAENREPVRDPLTHVSAPGDSRRSRLLATALPVQAGAGEVLVGSSDRVARRLTEERLYDSISRIGLKGDRVAIRF